MKQIFVVILLMWSTAAQTQNSECACCNENARAFDFWLGEWQVSANGKVTGQNSIDKIQGECVLRESWTSASPGYTGTSYNFYNTSKKQW